MAHSLADWDLNVASPNNRVAGSAPAYKIDIYSQNAGNW